MIAVDLYNKLEVDFRLASCRDDWSEMDFNEYITQNFRERYMGLVSDNTEVINYVYTAVFPSDNVIAKIVRDDRREALLFVHHPMTWDITQTPVFADMSVWDLKMLSERKISIYNLHVPLDANGRYGTASCFAEMLGLSVTGEFYEYHGVNVGIIGKTKYDNINQLRTRLVNAVGHRVQLYQYGGKDLNIRRRNVGIVAGGGNDAAIYPFLKEHRVNTYITGVAAINEDYPPSVEAHRAAQECGVNIIAATHYSTEKFACKKMVEYFAKLDIPGEFVPSAPCLEDM